MSVRIVEWLPPLFRDRAEAGEALAAAMPGGAALVVGLARGGVAVALPVARRLGVPLAAVGVKRVDAAGRRLGATTADGPPFLLGVAEGEEVRDLVRRAQADAAAVDRRVGGARPEPAGLDVVVVDDGLVTGLTLAAGCVRVRAAGAATVTAAVPVGAPRGLERVASVADAVVCPHVVDRLAVVGQAYDSFEPLDEWYVAGLLREAGG